MAYRYEQAFTKPRGLKYTDMCIYIDKTIYKPDITEEEKETIYKYLYLIIYGLACKKQYLKKKKDYDYFSLYASQKIWLRLTNYRQFLDEGDPKKLDKVKSVLNYIKNCIYGMKVDWCRDNYKEVIDPEVNTEFDFYVMEQNMKSNIESQYTYGSADFEKSIIESIEDIKSIIISVIKETPYKKDPLMMKRLYESCLISFVKSVTLSNKNKEKLENKLKVATNIDELYYNIYKEERATSIVTWHLDNSFTDYIKLLMTKIRKRFLNDLIDVKSTFELSDDILESILLSASEVKPDNIGDMNYD